MTQDLPVAAVLSPALVGTPMRYCVGRLDGRRPGFARMGFLVVQRLTLWLRVPGA
jgi:hypothetical protein